MAEKKPEPPPRKPSMREQKAQLEEERRKPVVRRGSRTVSTRIRNVRSY